MYCNKTEIIGLSNRERREIKIGDKVEVMRTISGHCSLYMCVPGENDMLKLVDLHTGRQLSPQRKQYFVGDNLEGTMELITKVAWEIFIEINGWEE